MNDHTQSMLENIKLKERISELEYQARKSICQSCVSMTNEAHNQDCIIEDLKDRLAEITVKYNLLSNSLKGKLRNE